MLGFTALSEAPLSTLPAATSNVTITLSGQAITASAGTLAPSIALALSGSAITSAAGTIAPSVAVALLGLQATLAAGTIAALVEEASGVDHYIITARRTGRR